MSRNFLSAAKAPHHDRVAGAAEAAYHDRTTRYALGVALLVSVLASTGSAPIRAQSSAKAAASPFTPSQVQFLLLFVEKQEETFEEVIADEARGWSIFKDLKPAAGKLRTYVLMADPADGDFADPASFLEAVRPYVAAAPGNVLKSEARFAMGTPGGAATGSDTAIRGDTPTGASTQAPAESSPFEWTFTGDTGLVMFFVKPAGHAQFESVLDKIRVASRDQDAKTGRPGDRSSVYRISDLTPNGLQIYALVLSPIDPSVNYAFGPLLGRALSGSALQEAYTEYATSVSGANLFDLKRVAGK